MSLILSVIAIGLIITIHELGHFTLAKAFKVGVVEFSVGMGPKLLSKVKGNTCYSLRLLPFGGSCMMLGEEDEESEDAEARKRDEFNNLTFNKDTVTVKGDQIIVDGRSYDRASQFYNKPAWQRFLIIAAGPLFNFLLAFLLAVILTQSVGWDRPELLEISAGSPAEEAGLEVGDRVTSLSINGKKMTVNTSRDISLFFTVHEEELPSGNPVVVSFERNGEAKTASLKPKFNEEEGRYLLGISYGLYYRPLEKSSELLPASFYNLLYTFRSTFESLKMLFTGKVRGDDVSGIVGMVAVMDENVEEAAKAGGAADALLTLINICIIISGSLGITNLLPFPALDGGRLVFIVIELLTGKAVPKKIEGYIHSAGMILLLALMAFIMANDVWKLIR